jgi:ATP-binding cassette subfamily B protein
MAAGKVGSVQPIPVRSYLTLLGRYLRPQWRRVVALAVLLFAAISLQLAGPQIMRYFIDTATGGHTLGMTNTSQALTVAALLYLATALAGQVVALLETYTAETVAWVATNRLRAGLMLHCLRLDMSYHNTHTPGELIERIDGDVSLLANFLSRFVVQVLGNALLLVGILILLFRVHWLVGATFTGLAVLTLAVLSRVQGLAATRFIATRQASANLFGFLEERLSGAEDIRSANAVPSMVRRLLVQMRDLLRKERSARLVGTVLGNTLNAAFVLVTAAAFILGAALFRAGTITLGTVYLIVNYTALLRSPIDQINRHVADLQQATAGIVRIRQLLETRSALEERGGAGARGHGSTGARGYGRRSSTPALPHSLTPVLPRPSSALAVELDHVTFGYSTGEPVLHDACLSLPAGKVLGLLGRTGSGKTTIARLLFRLYDPDVGSVRVGGRDVRDVSRAELTRSVGMITQEVQLFHATVRDNLALFDRTVADATILAAINELGLEPWYRSLARGLDTPLAGGSGLSAGEAQLLAFVRVFLKDPGLVILDEATARLDPATEALLERAVSKLLAGRTGIVIAHRLGTLQRADDILVLEQGRVVEQGDRAALADDPSTRYAGFLRTGAEVVV